MRLFVPKHADVRDTDIRQQREHSFDQPQPRAKYGRHDHRAGQRAPFVRGQRSLDHDGARREIARGLDDHERGQLVQPRAELAGIGLHVAQLRELDLDERMLDERNAGRQVFRHGSLLSEIPPFVIPRRAWHAGRFQKPR